MRQIDGDGTILSNESMTLTIEMSEEDRRRALMIWLGKDIYNARVLKRDGHLDPDNCWRDVINESD